MEHAGIYLHIPYCVKKCDYCDFFSISDVSGQSLYFETMHREMEAYRGKNISVDSVFIGGGTPSVADAGEIARLLFWAREIFSFEPDTEITIELNPKTFDEEKLKIYREAGVNRISMGLQSANNDELKKLGRIHTVEEFLHSYELLCKMGFLNINTDVMYGLPDSSQKTLERTLSFLKTLDCQHISAYALTLAEDSKMYQRGYQFPDDDGVYEQYQLVCEMLGNYRHYEISNFVKMGKSPCRHNLKYWQRVPYLGFGAAAHSFYEDARWSNPANLEVYVKQIQMGEPASDWEKISLAEGQSERLMLALRLDKGITEADVPEGFFEKNKDFIERYLEAGYLLKTPLGYRLSEDGFFVSNALISSFLERMG